MNAQDRLNSILEEAQYSLRSAKKTEQEILSDLSSGRRTLDWDNGSALLEAQAKIRLLSSLISGIEADGIEGARSWLSLHTGKLLRGEFSASSTNHFSNLLDHTNQRATVNATAAFRSSISKL